jgi:hypothetical protein
MNDLIFATTTLLFLVVSLHVQYSLQKLQAYAGEARGIGVSNTMWVGHQNATGGPGTATLGTTASLVFLASPFDNGAQYIVKKKREFFLFCVV